MFATATAIAPAAFRRQAAAYREMGVATGVNTASPHGLIGMLYDGLLAAIAEARGAIRSRSIEPKGKAIGRAVRIVDEGLAAALNLEEGGPLAADLHRLYAYLGVRLTQANLHNDEAALDECVALVEPLRDAWAQIGTAATTGAGAGAR